MANTGYNTNITHDTNRLKNDLRRIEEEVAKLETEKTKMITEITSLSAMWEGPAKSAFAMQFQFDQMILGMTISRLKKYCNDIRDICATYEKADSDVAAEIAQLR